MHLFQKKEVWHSMSVKSSKNVFTGTGRLSLRKAAWLHKNKIYIYIYIKTVIVKILVKLMQHLPLDFWASVLLNSELYFVLLMFFLFFTALLRTLLTELTLRC